MNPRKKYTLAWVGRLLFNVSVDTEGYAWSSKVKLGGKVACVTHAVFATKIEKII